MKKASPINIHPLVQAVELQSVCWRDVHAKRLMEQSEITSLTMQPMVRAEGHRDEGAEQLVVLVDYEMEATDDEAGTPAARIGGTIALRYALNGVKVTDFDSDQVQEFARRNGVFNAHPYWREFLQSAGARIGLYGIVAPVLRIAQPTPEAEGNEAKKTTK